MQAADFEVIAELQTERNQLLEQRAALAHTLSQWYIYQMAILPFLAFGLYHWVIWEVCALHWASYIGSVCLIISSVSCVILNLLRPERYVAISWLMGLDILLVSTSPGLLFFFNYQDLAWRIRGIGCLSVIIGGVHTCFGLYYTYTYHRLTQEYALVQKKYENALAWFQLITRSLK